MSANLSKLRMNLELCDRALRENVNIWEQLTPQEKLTLDNKMEFSFTYLASTFRKKVTHVRNYLDTVPMVEEKLTVGDVGKEKIK